MKIFFLTLGISKLHFQFQLVRIAPRNFPGPLESIDVNSFNVYPIPSSYNVTIQTLLGSTENSFELYNISGMLVDKQNFNQSTDIDLSTLAKGTYVLKIHNSQGYINKKIIVE